VVFFRRRPVAPPPALLDLHPEQLAHQGRPGRGRRLAQEVLDPRLAAPDQGVLEAVADVVHLTGQRQG
jgi:hypothetical protein